MLVPKAAASRLATVDLPTPGRPFNSSSEPAGIADGNGCRCQARVEDGTYPLRSFAEGEGWSGRRGSRTPVPPSSSLSGGRTAYSLCWTA